MVWRSQNPAIQIQIPVYGRVQWFLGMLYSLQWGGLYHLNHVDQAFRSFCCASISIIPTTPRKNYSFSHNHEIMEVENGCLWKVTILLEIYTHFSTSITTGGRVTLNQNLKLWKMMFLFISGWFSASSRQFPGFPRTTSPPCLIFRYVVQGIHHDCLTDIFLDAT